MLDFEHSFRRALLQWFRQNARDLPWRRNPSLYKAVVSEFMLQQTQVKTVLPYFERWMNIFPNFESLASASVEDVLHAWSGLGYYARARHLHQTAQRFVQNSPRSYRELRTCPGIGSYTAAAIASIAWNEPIAAVDGNVVRVLARVFNYSAIFTSKADAIAWTTPHAQKLLDKEQAGTFNEAMMELGAVVCTPTTPDCKHCPIQTLCKAFREHTVEICPRFQPTPRFKETINRLWLLMNGKLLLEPSRIGGGKTLWELPELMENRQKMFPNLKEIFRAKRSITNTTYTEVIYQPFTPATAENHSEAFFTQPPFEGCRWFPLQRLDTVALSGPHRRWIEEILERNNPKSDR
jgi:A/G-specific adenine glycosylase